MSMTLPYVPGPTWCATMHTCAPAGDVEHASAPEVFVADGTDVTVSIQAMRSDEYLRGSGLVDRHHLVVLDLLDTLSSSNSDGGPTHIHAELSPDGARNLARHLLVAADLAAAEQVRVQAAEARR